LILGDAVFRTEPDDFDSPALSFDGVDDYVDIPDSFGTFSEIYIEAMVKFNAVDKVQTIVCFFKDNRLRVGLQEDGKIKWSGGDKDGSWDRTIGSVLSVGVWYKVGWKWDGENVTIYIDDQEDATGTQDGMDTRDESNSIGFYAPTSDRYFDGELAYVKVWQDSNQNNILFDYPINEGTGTTLTDSAGTNDGTIIGATWQEVE